MLFRSKFQELRNAYPGSKLIIVSNTAGTDSDKHQAEAALLEKNTGVKVLRHSTKVCICIPHPRMNAHDHVHRPPDP